MKKMKLWSVTYRHLGRQFAPLLVKGRDKEMAIEKGFVALQKRYSKFGTKFPEQLKPWSIKRLSFYE